MIDIIVIAHGNLAEEFLKSVEKTAGRQESLYALNMSPEDSLESLKKKIEIFLRDKNGEDGCLIFVDMIGGTPFNACGSFADVSGTEVIAGVNLPMLLSAVFHREKMNLCQLADKVCFDGKKTINTLKNLLKNK